MIDIDGYAFYGAYLLALGCVKVTHTLSTFIRVYFVNLITLVNSVIRAGRFTDVTVNALISNYQRHGDITLL